MKFLVADQGEHHCKIVTDQVFDLDIEGEVGKAYSLAAELNAREEEFAEAIRLLGVARKYLPKLGSLPLNTELQVGVDAKQIDKFLATALSAKGEQPPPPTSGDRE